MEDSRRMARVHVSPLEVDNINGEAVEHGFQEGLETLQERLASPVSRDLYVSGKGSASIS